MRECSRAIPRPSDDTMRRFRLESALSKQKGAERGALIDAVCEVCQSVIHHYTGPLDGIVCASCFKPAFTHGLVKGRLNLGTERLISNFHSDPEKRQR